MVDLERSQSCDLTGLPLPPGFTEPDGSLKQSEKAPITDGSFFDESPATDNLLDLPRRAPTDEDCNVPYLMLPVELRAAGKDGNLLTYHHLHYYNRTPHLGGGTTRPPEQLSFERLAGLAVRVSIGEYLTRSTHEAAHSRFPLGPELPTTIEGKFARALAASTGIVPRQVIDIRREPGDELISVDNQTFAGVASHEHSGLEHFRTQKKHEWARRILTLFFLESAARQVIPYVDPVHRQRVLDTDCPETQLAAATEVLMIGLEVAIEPYETKFKALRQAGMARTGAEDTLTELRKIIIPNAMPHAVDRLTGLLKRVA